MGQLYITVNRPKSVPLDTWYEVAKKCLDYVIDISPVDTGRFSESWTLSTTDEGFVLHDDCEYSSYLDRGWSKQAPQGLTRPLLEYLKSLLGMSRVKHKDPETLYPQRDRNRWHNKPKVSKKRLFSFTTRLK